MTLEAQVAVTPVGKPVAVPILVAPVVAIVIGVRSVFTHKDGLDEGAAAVLVATTVIEPVALTLPQPPVNGME